MVSCPTIGHDARRVGRHAISIVGISAVLVAIAGSIGCQEKRVDDTSISSGNSSLTHGKRSMLVMTNDVTNEVTGILVPSGSRTLLLRPLRKGRLRHAVPLGDGRAYAVVVDDSAQHAMVLSIQEPGKGTERSVLTATTLGVPVFDPSTKRLAIVSSDGAPPGRLIIFNLATDNITRTSIDGDFRCDGFGPHFTDASSRFPNNVLCTTNVAIQRVSFEHEGRQPVCRGEGVIGMISTNGFAFMLGSGVYHGDLDGSTDHLIADVGYLNPFYRAARVSPDRTQVAIHALAPFGPSGGSKKSVPAIQLINLQTRSVVSLCETGELNGPWAWIADSENEGNPGQPPIKQNQNSHTPPP